MRQSEKIDQIAAALLKVQAEVRAASKSGKNEHLRTRYPTLNDVWDVCRDPLQKHQIAVFQTAEGGDDTGISIVTMLCHVSGQYLGGEFRIPIEWVTDKNANGVRYPSAQKAGSAVSYGRRYGLAAAVGVVSDDEDDDGHAASQRSAPTPQRAPAPRQASAPAPAPAPTARNGQDNSALPFGKSKGTPNKDLTDDQLISAYNWAAEKQKYEDWRLVALIEIGQRGLDPSEGYR